MVPPSAKAVINHRVHPSQTVAEAIAYDRKIISDPRVHIRVKTFREAHPVSPFGLDCIPFQMVMISIQQVFTDAVVVPGKYIQSTCLTVLILMQVGNSIMPYMRNSAICSLTAFSSI